MNDKPNRATISAEQVANYAVCPEAWRLKYLERERREPTQRSEEGQRLRQEWVATQDLSATLRHYAKIVYLMVVLVTILVFFLEHKRSTLESRETLEAPRRAEAR